METQAKGEDEELTSDTEVDELPETGDRVTDIQETGIRKAEELERPPEDYDAGTQQDAQQVLLRKASADPSEFLRRRFRLQRERLFSDVKEGGETW